jgi:coenzyme F420 hydrogenase subunit beta
MKSEKKARGQKELREKILNTGLCTHCGACVNLCPYAVAYRDKVILLDSCDREEGRCYAFCPRTPTDLEALRQKLFDPGDLTPEVGALKGFYLVRSADPEIRSAAQHGGTVTTLVSLALEEGMIDTAVLVDGGKDLLPEGIVLQNRSEIGKYGRSRFVASPNLAAFHQAARGAAQKIGVVATPCQALALAKMRLNSLPVQDSSVDKLRLVIGLFCGWAFSWRRLKPLLEEKFGLHAIIGLDIPPSKHHSMEVHTRKGIFALNLDEVLPCVREACHYCFDMTAEFSDLSVGSARLPEGWEVARGWNQLIVRTTTGQALLERARDRGLLEFREMPSGNLERLKKASWNKKRAAVKNLIERSGSPKDWIYLDARDSVLGNLNR